MNHANGRGCPRGHALEIVYPTPNVNTAYRVLGRSSPTFARLAAESEVACSAPHLFCRTCARDQKRRAAALIGALLSLVVLVAGGWQLVLLLDRSIGGIAVAVFLAAPGVLLPAALLGYAARHHLGVLREVARVLAVFALMPVYGAAVVAAFVLGGWLLFVAAAVGLPLSCFGLAAVHATRAVR